MTKHLLLLLALFICHACAFSPSMCRTQPKPPVPLELQKIKDHFPVVIKHRHDFFNRSMDLQREKIYYVATFTRKGVILRPKKFRLRKHSKNKILDAVWRVWRACKNFF